MKEKNKNIRREINYLDKKVVVFANDNIYENQKDLDDVLIQAKNIFSIPSVYDKVFLMPDFHKGYGFPIGGVGAFENVISPGGIGYDVNCGVSLFFVELSKEKILSKKDELIEKISKNIGIGFGSKGNFNLDFNRVCIEGLKYLKDIGIVNDNDIKNTNFNGSFKGSLEFVSNEAILRGKRTLGSLGAGNHFVDLMDVSDINKDNNYEILDKNIFKGKKGILLMIHTGSRGFGHQIISDYISKIRDLNIDNFENLKEKDLAYISKDSSMFNEFVLSMNSACNFAFVNRRLIFEGFKKVLEDLYGEFYSSLIYDISHNIATFEKHFGKDLIVHRKGATLALGGKNFKHDYYKNQPIIIPGSNATSSYLLFGLENDSSLSLQSCCHGSGRSVSRKYANENYDIIDIKKDFRKKGIIFYSASKDSVLEESFLSYKDSKDVVETIIDSGIATMGVRFEPFIVFQG
ncbi:MAG: RtcB family protein [Candidatus Nanoarchaeia archaeon]|nr:RtcB family protein [Candidatus Nanoarchaeia archaeon]